MRRLEAEHGRDGAALSRPTAAAGHPVTTHLADVSIEAQLWRSATRSRAQQETDKIHLLFNNAGIGGGGSFDDRRRRADWEKTFNVCWGGVYYGCAPSCRC